MEFQFTEESNRFVAKDEQGIEAGEVTYNRGGEGVLVIDHTGVDPAYRGHGLAEKLVQQVIGKAKNEGLKIEPVCSYAKKVLENNEQYQDVLAQ